jgi:hypothetical protein
VSSATFDDLSTLLQLWKPALRYTGGQCIF